VTIQIVNVDDNTYLVNAESIKPVRTQEYFCEAWKLQPSRNWHKVENWNRLDQLARIVNKESSESLSELSKIKR
jgi:hypothetical protein